MRALCLLPVLLLSAASAQQPTSLPVQTALQLVFAETSLAQSAKPFHAVLQITGPTPEYTGRVDLTWASAHLYRLQLTAPHFTQLRLVNGDQIAETDTGDYFPRWLQTLSTALLDPAVLTRNFTQLQDTLDLSNDQFQHCLRRDDRNAGITDQLTWGNLCFTGPSPRLQSVLTFNTSIQFADFKAFGQQHIPRTLTTTVLDFRDVTGHLSTLDAITPDPALFAIAAPTPAAGRIDTAFVSTLQEEGMVESAPHIAWPTVREGKTQGYMIVYARTDRTGQVRETAKHNSDQPGLEEFGTQQALLYKFKPLLIDGIARQMEMPLVLHFTTTLADPVPILTDAQTRAHISGCTLARPKPNQLPFRIRVSVNEQGKLAGEGYPEANIANAPHRSSDPNLSLRSCTFAPYLVNGKPTYYHGDLLLP